MQRVASETARRWPESPFGVIARVVLDLLARPIPERTAVMLPAQVRELSADSESIARGLTCIFGGLGASDVALDALEDAIRRGFAHYPYLAGHWHALAGLREHPRLRRMRDVVRERWERGGTSATDLATPLVGVPEVARQKVSPIPPRRGAHAPATGERRSVAVLPFANLSPDPENEFFADGLTDDLIAQVAKIGSLRVIARTSVMKFRGVADAARAAAKELGVSAVVEGTVRRAGRRARIVAQLTDPSSDASIWSETYDRDLEDFFSVQTEVATSVAGALKATLTPAEERRLARVPTRDAKAYDLYLIGRQLFSRRTPDSLRAAISHFEQAIERDATFAGAFAAGRRVCVCGTRVRSASGVRSIRKSEGRSRAGGGAG